MFTLIIEDKDGAIADEYSFEEGEFIIGRSHSSDIILPSDNVSRRHARLYTQDSKCYVEDLNSSNGVFVNGKRIHRVFEIVRSAQIKVGDYYLHVEGTTYAAEGDPERQVDVQQGQQAQLDMGANPIQVESSSVASASQPSGRLIGTNLATQGRPFDLARPVMLVGRGKDCAITIIDPSVSRVHAKVLRGPGGLLSVEDLRSSNGTYVNDERVERSQFGHGDAVRFGNVEFMCEMPGFGDPDVIEVSSGGRRGLLFLVGFLVLVLVAGSITIYALRDKLFGPSDIDIAVEKEKAEQARDGREKEREEEYKLAKERIERYAKRAARMAGEDDWAGAKQALEKGAKELKKLGRLDKTGELTAYFEGAEQELLDERRIYREFVDNLEERNYVAAGTSYTELSKLEQSAFVGLARTKLNPAKNDLLSSGEALCANQLYDKCLGYYQKAKALDPTDKEIAKKVARTRLKIK